MTPELRQVLSEFKRQALHAFALGFTHPDTKQPMHFEVDLPEDINRLLDSLRTDKLRGAK